MRFRTLRDLPSNLAQVSGESSLIFRKQKSRGLVAMITHLELMNQGMLAILFKQSGNTARLRHL